MQDSLRTRIEEMFRAVEAKDRDTALSFFAPDGMLIDPHYPHKEMKGQAAIGAGLDWLFAGVEQPGFGIVGWYTSDDGTSAAVEVATHHRLTGGRTLHFPETFIIETRDGKITRMQGYPPYGPSGMKGLLLGLKKWQYRLFHR
jgi:ketosteroid isomerase-like protein